MIPKNLYLQNVLLDEVESVIAKDKNTNKLVKISVDDIKAMAGSVIEIVQFMGVMIPAGLLLCDGKMYRADNYPDLFAVIGRDFSDPNDPPDTFRVPDLVTDNRFLLSGDDVKYKSAGFVGDRTHNYIYCDDSLSYHAHAVRTRGGRYIGHSLAFAQPFWKKTWVLETSESGWDETAGKSMAVNFCIRTGRIIEVGLERMTTDGDLRETTQSGTRMIYE